MSLDQNDPFNYLLEKGLWFSIIPLSQKEWEATIFKLHDDGRWYGFKSKVHPSVELAMEWMGDIFKKETDGQEDV